MIDELSTHIRKHAFLPSASWINSLHALRTDVVVIRPWSPRNRPDSPIIVAKNEKWPRVQGIILAIPAETLLEHPDMRPGVHVIYSRFSDEQYGEDESIDPTYSGPRLPVNFIHVDEICAVIDPPLAPAQF